MFSCSLRPRNRRRPERRSAGSSRKSRPGKNAGFLNPPTSGPTTAEIASQALAGNRPGIFPRSWAEQRSPTHRHSDGLDGARADACARAGTGSSSSIDQAANPHSSEPNRKITDARKSSPSSARASRRAFQATTVVRQMREQERGEHAADRAATRRGLADDPRHRRGYDGGLDGDHGHRRHHGGEHLLVRWVVLLVVIIRFRWERAPGTTRIPRSRRIHRQKRSEL